MLQQIQETKDYLLSKNVTLPQVGIILGSGLGNLANEIIVEKAFPYNDIPNFPTSTVEGHSGKLLFGKINGVNVVAMQGRFHYYEGYSSQETTFPVRVMKALGIEYLLLSNASGGTNENFEIGDVMLITDHINMIPDNPLRGKNYNELGPRFPDMSEPYSKDLNKKILKIADQHKIKLLQGVYVAFSGPTYETPSEYKYVKIIGGDAVGMSTAPEVIVANHMGIPCAAFSVITDLGVEGKIVEISHEEVQEIAAKAEPKMTLIIKELLSTLYIKSEAQI